MVKFVDKTTGVVFIKKKCPNCGIKSFVSFEGKQNCPSCGSEITMKARGRSESKVGKVIRTIGKYTMLSSVLGFVINIIMPTYTSYMYYIIVGPLFLIVGIILWIIGTVIQNK